MPQGSIYGLEPNKSVELVIPGGAIGGPVSRITDYDIVGLTTPARTAPSSFTWA